MKTAEEWVNDTSPLDRCSCECETRLEEVEQWLKQIQLDAIKEGYMIGVQDTKNKTTTDLNSML